MNYYLVDAIHTDGSRRHERLQMLEVSKREVRAKLKKKGFIAGQILELHPESGNVHPSYCDLKSEFLKQLSLYWQKAATNDDLKNGLIPMFARARQPIHDALRVWASRLPFRRPAQPVGAVLAEIIRQIAEDKTRIHDALATAPHIFSNTETALIATADRQGKVTEVLTMLSDQNRKRGMIASKVSSALWYPKVLLGLIGCLLVLVIFFLAPTLREFYASLGIPLIFPLNVLTGINDAVREPLVAIAVALGTALIVAVSVALYKLSPQLRYRLDFARLHVPGVGALEKSQRLVNALFAIDMMVRSGELKFALNTAYISADGPVFRRALRAACDRMANKEVATLADALREESEIFDPLIIGMLHSAEKFNRTGTDIPEAIDIVRDRINDHILALPKQIEVAMMILIGIVLCFLSYAIIVPTRHAVAHIH
jgi:type IV pilus assembly protein PilC